MQNSKHFYFAVQVGCAENQPNTPQMLLLIDDHNNVKSHQLILNALGNSICCPLKVLLPDIIMVQYK